MSYITNLPHLRKRVGEHGPALANYAEWSAILHWLKSAPATTEPIEVATVACELVREGRAIRAKLPLRHLPKFATIGNLSTGSHTEAIRVAEETFRDWLAVGRPHITPARLTRCYKAFRSAIVTKEQTI